MRNCNPYEPLIKPIKPCTIQYIPFLSYVNEDKKSYCIHTDVKELYEYMHEDPIENAIDIILHDYIEREYNEPESKGPTLERRNH